MSRFLIEERKVKTKNAWGLRGGDECFTEEKHSFDINVWMKKLPTRDLVTFQPFWKINFISDLSRLGTKTHSSFVTFFSSTVQRQTRIRRTSFFDPVRNKLAKASRRRVEMLFFYFPSNHYTPNDTIMNPADARPV